MMLYHLISFSKVYEIQKYLNIYKDFHCLIEKYNAKFDGESDWKHESIDETSVTIGRG